MEKETIELVRKMIEDGNLSQEIAEKYCPEIMESEDERIGKFLLESFKSLSNACPNGYYRDDITYKDVVAWLEKQGEPAEINPTEFDSQLNKLLKQFEALPKEELANSLSFYLNVIQNDGTYKEEKQGKQKSINSQFTPEQAGVLDKHIDKFLEQKPADKIEPTFNVGDWLLCKNLVNKPFCITEVKESYYLTSCGSFIMFGQEDDYRNWAIQDAKDGDVLVASDGSIFLFKGVFKGAIDCACKHYAALTTDGAFKFNEGLEHYWETPTAVHPATTEQRDLLFQKMHDAGYEWDADKRELKKIEQNPWSEEDEDVINHILAICAGAKRYRQFAGCLQEDITKYQTWLKSLRPQKPLTNEEIEQAKKEYRNVALSKMDYIPEELTYDDGWDDAISYMKKSLRPQTSLEAG